MEPRTILGVGVAMALGAAGYAVGREPGERTASSAMVSGAMIGDGSAGMMDGCGNRMHGSGMASGQPNAQWHAGIRKAHAPEREKQQ
jgi:hypothetical protein